MIQCAWKIVCLYYRTTLEVTNNLCGPHRIYMCPTYVPHINITYGAHSYYQNFTVILVSFSTTLAVVANEVSTRGNCVLLNNIQDIQDFCTSVTLCQHFKSKCACHNESLCYIVVLL